MLTEQLAANNIRDYATVNEPPDPRYLLYLYYRHLGNWAETLGIDTESDKYRLTNDDLAALPPVFIAHAKGDPDVPLFFSRKLAKTAAISEFVEVDTVTHNFDQEVSEANIKIYERAVQFMAEQV